MSTTLVFNKNTYVADSLDAVKLVETVSQVWGINQSDFYLLYNGRRISNKVPPSSQVSVVLRLVGGKGGFGSMLRAIGAQIEKTTNREACRDLSGRRLRDINEEKRLKNWLAAQQEREKEAEDRKQKKLERLCELPKHEFKDEDYIKERASLPEKIEDAVAQGMKAACSTKRPSEAKDKRKKKKPKLWVDDDIELSSSEDEDGSSSSPRTDSENSMPSSEQENVKSSDENKAEAADENKAEAAEENKKESSTESSQSTSEPELKETNKLENATVLKETQVS